MSLQEEPTFPFTLHPSALYVFFPASDEQHFLALNEVEPYFVVRLHLVVERNEAEKYVQPPCAQVFIYLLRKFVVLRAPGCFGVTLRCRAYLNAEENVALYIVFAFAEFSYSGIDLARFLLIKVNKLLVALYKLKYLAVFLFPAEHFVVKLVVFWEAIYRLYHAVEKAFDKYNAVF